MLPRYSIATLALALLTLAAAPPTFANVPAEATLAHISISVESFDNTPTRGEAVFFRGPLSNTAGPDTYVYVYFVVQRPDGSTFKKNLGGRTLVTDQTINFRDIPGNKRKNYVPLSEDAQAGTWTVTIYAASDNLGTTIFSQDSFQFTLPPLDNVVSAPVQTTASLEIAEPMAAPNPFRESTTIRYALADDAEVDLRVYDVTGREVADLVSGTQAAGTHSATLRAGDLPGGVYVWRLAVGGEVTTGRVTLAR